MHIYPYILHTYIYTYPILSPAISHSTTHHYHCYTPPLNPPRVRPSPTPCHSRHLSPSTTHLLSSHGFHSPNTPLHFPNICTLLDSFLTPFSSSTPLNFQRERKSFKLHNHGVLVRERASGFHPNSPPFPNSSYTNTHLLEKIFSI